MRTILATLGLLALALALFAPTASAEPASADVPGPAASPAAAPAPAPVASPTPVPCTAPALAPCAPRACPPPTCRPRTCYPYYRPYYATPRYACRLPYVYRPYPCNAAGRKGRLGKYYRPRSAR